MGFDDLILSALDSAGHTHRVYVGKGAQRLLVTSFDQFLQLVLMHFEAFDIAGPLSKVHVFQWNPIARLKLFTFRPIITLSIFLGIVGAQLSVQGEHILEDLLAELMLGKR